MEVELTTGQPQMETPAARTRRRKAEEHEEAEAVLLKDANVQALLRDFDGRLESPRLHRQPPEAPAPQAAPAAQAVAP